MTPLFSLPTEVIHNGNSKYAHDPFLCEAFSNGLFAKTTYRPEEFKKEEENLGGLPRPGRGLHYKRSIGIRRGGRGREEAVLGQAVIRAIRAIENQFGPAA